MKLMHVLPEILQIGNRFKLYFGCEVSDNPSCIAKISSENNNMDYLMRSPVRKKHFGKLTVNFRRRNLGILF